MCREFQKTCFVIMPFGKKTLRDGVLVDFDAVYADFIRPALQAAGLEPDRADTTFYSGVIHEHMLDRIVFSDYVLADISLENANVFWELGIRHALHPSRTLLLRGGTSAQGPAPFDIAFLQFMPYAFDTTGTIVDLAVQRNTLISRLKQVQDMDRTDSPLYTFFKGIQPPEIARCKTDIVLQHFAQATSGLLGELAHVLRTKDKNDALALLQDILKKYAPIANLNAFAQTALFLAHRESGLWYDMVALYPQLDAQVQKLLLIQEQYALALNRCGSPASPENVKAEQILRDCLKEYGNSSETCGLLGRIYKDRYAYYRDNGNVTAAQKALQHAIEAYTDGFKADWRDAYPGINAVTLRELAGPSGSPQEKEMLSVVKWSARQRAERPNADYWDAATLMEAAAIDRDWHTANEALDLALVQVHVMPWMRETTANNLELLSVTREQRGEDCASLRDLIIRLQQ